MKWPTWLAGLSRKSGQSVSTSLELFREIYGARTSRTGITIGWTDALRCATAFACARVIATGLAQVPLKVYQQQPGGGKRPAADHPLYDLLHRRPNPWQTSYELRELLGLHLAIAGRAYCYKVVVGGQLRELIPLEPNRVVVKLEDDDVTLRYEVTSRKGELWRFTADQIWHLKGPSWVGYEAMDALDLAREALGLSLAAESSQAKLHANGLRPSGVYSVEGSLSEVQYKQLRQFLAENHAGENSSAPMILDRGAKWLGTVMSGVDAQHLETRRFQVEEVCRAMGVMPIMVFSSDKATTYASVEAMLGAHITHTLAPLWARVEQSIDCNLLTQQERQAGLYTRFVGNGLLRGAMRDRADYYAKALGAGGSPAWMTPDEVRLLEEMDPLGGAASLLPTPTNVAPAPAGAATP